VRKYLFLILCAALCTAVSCNVRIGAPRESNNPVSPSAPANPAAIINSFTTDNAFITLQQSTTLRWSAVGVCRIEPTVGDVPNTGNTPITPLFTTTYTLSCSSNGSSVARTVTVTVR
jgi:hypothetical protein